MNPDSLPKTKSAALAAGVKKYFTDRPCSKGHTSARYVSGHCCECRRAIDVAKARDPQFRAAKAAYDAAYREANAERLKALRREYHVANRERVNAKSTAYYYADRERQLAQRRAYAKKNREVVAARAAEWRAANVEKRRLNHAAWQEANMPYFRKTLRAMGLDPDTVPPSVFAVEAARLKVKRLLRKEAA